VSHKHPPAPLYRGGRCGNNTPAPSKRGNDEEK